MVRGGRRSSIAVKPRRTAGALSGFGKKSEKARSIFCSMILPGRIRALTILEMPKPWPVLAREVQGGVFGFDEYRHGHGRVESFSTFLLRLPGAGNFCLIAAVLVGIYFFGRNVRFGPPELFVVPERRTAREYVEAAAFLNQRARAAPLAVESIVRRIRAISLR